MGTFALTNVASYVNAHDFTSDTNQATLAVEAAALDKTTFASGGWSEMAGGLKSVTFTLAGFWQSAVVDAVDVEAFPDLGGPPRAHTVSPTGVEGDPAFMFSAGKFSYNFGGAVGELAPFTLTSQGAGAGVVRGRLAKARAAVTAAGPLGLPLNLGAPAAGDTVWANVHVFAASGTTPNLPVQLQSDTTAAFTSPTTHASTITGFTNRGTYEPRVAGPLVGRTWWRLFAPSVSGTFIVAAAIGVQ